MYIFNLLYYNRRGIILSEVGPESRPSKVAELILKLQEDFKFLAEFNIDPDRVMIEAGISSEEDRNILKSGDLVKIRELVAKEIYDSKKKMVS